MRVKARIDFGFIPSEIISHEMTRPTQMDITIPHIRDINITWSVEFRRTIAQISYPLSEESKVKRIVEKYKGVVLQLREDLNQNAINETDQTSIGKTHIVELWDEILKKGTTL